MSIIKKFYLRKQQYIYERKDSVLYSDFNYNVVMELYLFFSYQLSYACESIKKWINIYVPFAELNEDFFKKNQTRKTIFKIDLFLLFNDGLY